MNRRWWVAAAVLVVVLVAVVISQTVFKEDSARCGPVREMLDFNSSQGEHIAAKGGDPVANLTAYQAWADGMADRAAKVEDPELATGALRLAQAADRFVRLLPQLPPPGADLPADAPAPPVVGEMAALNNQIGAQTNLLATACPA